MRRDCDDVVVVVVLDCEGTGAGGADLVRMRVEETWRRDDSCG